MWSIYNIGYKKLNRNFKGGRKKTKGNSDRIDKN